MHLFGYANDWPHIHSEIVSFKCRRVKTRNRAIEKEGVGTMKDVAEQNGELVEVQGGFADDEDGDTGRRNTDAIADEA